MAYNAVLIGRDAQVESLKLPPYSVAAEQAVLGGLLLDNSAWDKVGDVVSESDFYRSDHRQIYHHIEALITENKPADVLTSAESLRRAGKLEEVGGQSYVDSLAVGANGAVNIRRYAEIVRELSIMRKLAEVGTEIADSALNSLNRSARELLDQAETRVFQIAEASARQRQGFTDLNSLMSKVIVRIDEFYRRPDKSAVTGIATGYAELDTMTSGFQQGDLIIIAGRPSMGKTALALNISEHVALKVGLPVAIFSMEMSGMQLATRLLGSLSHVDQQRLRNGDLEPSDWDELTKVMGKLNDAPMYIDETAALNALELRARVRRLHRQVGGAGLGLIVVDYLQLMSATGHGENRATEISEISRSLKALAKELNVPVVALSQLNRSLESRQDKRPMMSDLRESGAIEQDADVILFIYRDEVYNPDTTQQKGLAEIIVGKQRNGPTGKVELTFLAKHTRFENYARPDRF